MRLTEEQTQYLEDKEIEDKKLEEEYIEILIGITDNPAYKNY